MKKTFLFVRIVAILFLIDGTLLILKGLPASDGGINLMNSSIGLLEFLSGVFIWKLNRHWRITSLVMAIYFFLTRGFGIYYMIFVLPPSRFSLFGQEGSSVNFVSIMALQVLFVVAALFEIIVLAHRETRNLFEQKS